MNISPLPMSEIVSFALAINGTAMDDTIQILSIHVHVRVNEKGTATLIIADGGIDGFTVSEMPAFKPGNTIQISLGYSGNNTTVFTGEIDTQHVVASNTGKLVITCSDNTIVQQAASIPDPSLQLTYGDNIYSFNLSVNNAGAIEGSVNFQGSNLAVPNAGVSLGGINAIYNKTLLMTGVKHTVERGNWLSEIHVSDTL